MLEYQKKLYAGYHTTHVVHRKGADDERSLALRGKVWDRIWHPLLPTDLGANILDAACGNGAMVAWLHSRGFLGAEGIDISAEVIAEGQRLGIGGLRVGDFVGELKSRRQAFDVVILRDVLEHFPKDQTLDVLEAVRGSLKPGGRVILHVPNADSPMFGRIRYGDFTHETAFTASSLSQVLLSTGFEYPIFRPSPPVATSARSAVRVRVFGVVKTIYQVMSWAETGKWPRVVTQNILCSAATSA